MSWLTRLPSPAKSILSLTELYNINNLKYKDLNPLLYPMPYKTPRTELDATLGKGSTGFFTGTFNPSRQRELKEYCRGLLPSLLWYWPFQQSCSVGSCWVSSAAHMPGIIMHKKTNKESSDGFKGHGICSPGWGGLTKSEEKSGFSNF